jgi:hypothetical protein
MVSLRRELNPGRSDRMPIIRLARKSNSSSSNNSSAESLEEVLRGS